MSKALYDIGSLRFWNEEEINFREMVQNRLAFIVQRTLLKVNPAWKFSRVEGPTLIPATRVSPAYTDKDVFVTNHTVANTYLNLRAETTDSSYTAARDLGYKLPMCVWQVGKSYRREVSDGATASKLRFNEFWQQEFQCIYSVGTKADYRAELIDVVADEISRFTGKPHRIVQSDRLPAYSVSTLDIEIPYNGDWKEIASCSIRTDYSQDTRVCEIAVGLDRVVEARSS